MIIVVGTETEGGTASGPIKERDEGFRFAALKSAKVEKLRAKGLSGATTSVRLAIVKPKEESSLTPQNGTILGETGALNIVAGAVEGTITPASIESGKNYWLCYEPVTGAGKINRHTGAEGATASATSLESKGTISEGLSIGWSSETHGPAAIWAEGTEESATNRGLLSIII